MYAITSFLLADGAVDLRRDSFPLLAYSAVYSANTVSLFH